MDYDDKNYYEPEEPEVFYDPEDGHFYRHPVTGKKVYVD